MKVLIFDTETGGVNATRNDILQLSYQIIDVETLVTVKEVDRFFAWPDDKSRVQRGAIEVNGLTEEYLATKELSERDEAIEEFFTDLNECRYCVAHNGDFDMKFINETARRENVAIPIWPVMIDTMKTTVNVCRIPKGRGYKWPKLIELAECLGIDTDDLNLHDSAADVELTKRCFIQLVRKKFYRI